MKKLMGDDGDYGSDYKRGRRGSRPKRKVKIHWSPTFAYAIGLLTTDGNLSPDERHITFTSKDKQLVEIFASCLGLKNRIGHKARGGSRDKKYYVLQFGDVIFYQFLMDIGLTPNKSKTLTQLKIPEKYLFDFLRGHFDGDGTFYSYWDPRWRSSYMFYTEFISASKKHIAWIRSILRRSLGVNGHVTQDGRRITYQLKYAKKESLLILRKIYHRTDVPCLIRKRLKIERALAIMNAVL